MADYIYDVALSFAGEDRDFVRIVADQLRMNGVRVFYDEYERANLWGKELIEFLEDIYGNKSKYVIIFISKSYLTKDWTNHERKSALNRAIINKREYILPVKLDDSKLPGLHESVAYLSSNNFTPSDICKFFLEKIGIEDTIILNQNISFYRISNKKYHNDLSGLGSSYYGGTWNKKGFKAIYASNSIALASLEVLVNISPISFFDDTNHKLNLKLTHYSLPSNIFMKVLYESDLPKNWKQNHIATQEIGSKWLDEGKQCILSLPSAVVTNERIYILNPQHEDIKKLSIIDTVDFHFDERLRYR